LEDSLTSERQPPSIDRLITLIETLRGENGCPWDRKQTPESISRYIIEESYELVDAILGGDPTEICEEAGDVLFQLFFIVHLYNEDGLFGIGDVLDRNLEKMIRRHPHVFGDETAETPEEVKKNWQTIKTAEKADGHVASILDGISQGIPALLRADMVSRRAAATGFDWTSIQGVMEKTMEEWREFCDEVDKSSPLDNTDRASDEFGDTLFTMVNVARFARIDPEVALIRAVQKFERRFRFMEMEALAKGGTLDGLSFDEMQNLWDLAKTTLG
jgi:MazG family protein